MIIMMMIILINLITVMNIIMIILLIIVIKLIMIIIMIIIMKLTMGELRQLERPTQFVPTPSVSE